jgi:NAD-dependent protein deacetylase/lipoamidase
MESQNLIQQAARLLAGVDRVVVLTGAGISAESGVPTFRGEDGLWRRFRAEELATPEAFARDPKLVWEWYDWRRAKIAAVRPNPGHAVLAKWEVVFADFLLVTQNVDGLHPLAGSKNLLELHGNIWKTRCTAEGTIEDNRDVPLPTIPPVCPRCGALLRPHIVWFGEALDEGVLERAFEASAACETMLVVGTSSLVYPAAALPVAAVRAGAPLIEINPSETPLTARATLSIRGPAGEVLPGIDAALASHQPAEPE